MSGRIKDAVINIGRTNACSSPFLSYQSFSPVFIIAAEKGRRRNCFPLFAHVATFSATKFSSFGCLCSLAFSYQMLRQAPILSYHKLFALPLAYPLFSFAHRKPVERPLAQGSLRGCDCGHPGRGRQHQSFRIYKPGIDLLYFRHRVRYGNRLSSCCVRNER